MPKHVVVVGGGISGLAAAERLVSDTSSDAPPRVTLLEASDRMGGVIRTDRQDEFLLESGPDVFLAAKAAGMEMCERLGLAERVIATRPSAKGSSILDGRRLRPIPEGMSGVIPSRLWPFVTSRLVSPIGKLRVALEYLLPARHADRDESIEQFIVRRLGRQMYERLVEPLMSGIFAGDGSRLSIGATFPQLVEMERDQGGLIRGTLAARRRNPPTPGPDRNRPTGLVSLQGGLGELVSALERTLNDRYGVHGAFQVRRNARVERVTRTDGRRGFVIMLANGEAVETDAVVVATPAPVSAVILRPLDAVVASELETIEYASTVTINVAYHARDVRAPLQGTGYTVPRRLGRPVLACTVTSNKFEGRAPPDAALFRLFLGGAGRGDFTRRSDDELLHIVRTEMREVLGVSAAPVLVRINRYDRVMAQYNVGHLDRLARIDQRLVRMPGVALAGNAFRGVGIPDCITSGRRAAELVLAGLQTRSYSISHLAS
jgi:oxygen-dependent protoporphyrinogen oxidase